MDHSAATKSNLYKLGNSCRTNVQLLPHAGFRISGLFVELVNGLTESNQRKKKLEGRAAFFRSSAWQRLLCVIAVRNLENLTDHLGLPRDDYQLVIGSHWHR